MDRNAASLVEESRLADSMAWQASWMELCLVAAACWVGEAQPYLLPLLSQLLLLCMFGPDPPSPTPPRRTMPMITTWRRMRRWSPSTSPQPLAAHASCWATVATAKVR